MTSKIPEDLIAKLLMYDWYYSIELRPGLFTPGKGFPNIALTRDLLRRCNVSGSTCLDIGTMEAIVPIILKRRGASEVVALDALDLSEKVNILKQLYEADFNYYGNISSTHILDFLTNRSQLMSFGSEEKLFGFDLVVLSGLLYHVFSPIHILAAARSCLRTGGLMVIETATVQTEDFYMRYNFTGTEYIYGWTDTWFISLPLLDYLCRFFKLAPLDCVFLEPSDQGFPDVVRVGIVCRAVDRFVHSEAENLMQQSARNLDYCSLVRYEAITNQNTELVKYDMRGRTVENHSGINTCNLLKSVQKGPPLSYGQDQIMLGLGSEY